MIKKTLYPKTKRISNKGCTTVITEKLDGSNLGFFKYGGKLYVAQRNYVYSLEHALVGSQGMYKGLHGWLQDHGSHLEDELQEGACIFGEWIGMGRIDYGGSVGKFNQFAKCNVTGPSLAELELKNLYYNDELFKWSYVSQELPEYISMVPIVYKTNEVVTVKYLDQMYSDYSCHVQRSVEGFIINQQGNITKYVRHKNGILQEKHKQ